ncbi:MAG: polyphosphate polymerase domain-containing protein [candidate division Zixibacteria bacterium]|nr:polyphosphate polymerase domain-containing protein [candidate division Zixibacteria bacterium]
MELDRIEYKYLVPNKQLDAIRSEISPFVMIDPHAIDRKPQEYTVRSLYFDTPTMNCYNEKIDGIKIRKKFRIRSYNEFGENDIIFLEIKRKYNNFISKNRAPLYNHNLQNLFETKNIDMYIIQSERNGLSIEDAQRFLYHYYHDNLIPSILIVYDREAYFSKFNERNRITFDKNLRSSHCTITSSLFNGFSLRTLFPKHFILEMKIKGGMPLWARYIIGKYQLPRLALSKYTLCLDSHGGIDNYRKRMAYSSLRRFLIFGNGQDNNVR